MGICASCFKCGTSSTQVLAAQGKHWGEKSSSSCLGHLPKEEVATGFAEVLLELEAFKDDFDGVKNFTGLPQIVGKVKATDFRRVYTDFEYIYLTVLGLGRLQANSEEIVKQNNGLAFMQNPGVQLLEKVCGMTMHAEREGANHLLRTGPACLLQAFAVAQQGSHCGLRCFFAEAFDRHADPCLEGRVSRLMEYLSIKAAGDLDRPTWEDLSVQKLSSTASAVDVVGEHLRVFVNQATWIWAQKQGVSYSTASLDRQVGRSPARLFSATDFEAWILAKGLAREIPTRRWEVQFEDGSWAHYEEFANEVLELVRIQGGSSGQVKVHAYLYEVNFETLVQKNLQSGKDRPVRWTPVTQPGQFALEDIKSAICYFVEMETLGTVHPADKPPGDSFMALCPGIPLLEVAVPEPRSVDLQPLCTDFLFTLSVPHAGGTCAGQTAES